MLESSRYLLVLQDIQSAKATYVIDFVLFDVVALDVLEHVEIYFEKSYNFVLTLKLSLRLIIV